LNAPIHCVEILMDETKQLSTLEGLTEAARVREHEGKRPQLATIRVSPGAYLATASVLTFCSGLLLRSDQNLWALALIAAAWLLVPALAIADRIAFDGDRLVRQGPIPFIARLISGKRSQLRLHDFERVDTNAVRTLRRGGRVRYRYRTQVLGKGAGFVFASGGKSYRQMVRQLFPLIADDKLDLRTRELRDYLPEPSALNAEVEALQLASADVLDQASAHFKLRAENGGGSSAGTSDVERARQLRLLGNRLRISGRLREAMEAFRRGLIVIPKDPWLIYDFARLLRSQASAQGDAKILSRAKAALRLSELRAGTDSKLLSLIGESFLECGEPERARRSFEKAIEIGTESFRAHLGLADVALRMGKLAHVIHQYRDASDSTNDKALLTFARREANYYASLNDDDQYLAAELRRINWLQYSIRVRRMAARITNASILIALVGSYVDPGIGAIGWALATSSLLAWIGSLFIARLLTERRKPRLAD
jgi:tetratricopeptide (TPR) repeat protein